LDTIAVSFVAFYIIGFEDLPSMEEDVKKSRVTEQNTDHALNTGIKIGSPGGGRTIPLKEVNEQTFSNEQRGIRVAGVPEKGEITAPFDVKIDVFVETGYSIGLKTETGEELLIHVGLDTVNLGGKYFNTKKEVGVTVKKGEKLLEFDIEKIQDAGFDLTTPIIVTNTSEFMEVIGRENEKVEKLESIITIV